jgi:hypothetical protein
MICIDKAYQAKRTNVDEPSGHRNILGSINMWLSFFTSGTWVSIRTLSAVHILCLVHGRAAFI